MVGATGNTGTALLRRLRREPDLASIVGVARRVPTPTAIPPELPAEVEWRSIDIAQPAAVGQLAEVFTGATAVVHLGWQIQPSHQPDRLRRTNVAGTAHVAEAAVRAGVPTLVVASSVGAYAPGPSDHRIDESWPTTGVPGSTYSAHKSAQERLLEQVSQHRPELRLVVLRPALIFQRDAASEIARYFLGPLAPLSLLRFGRLPGAPSDPRLRVQAVHADDVADAYLRAIRTPVRGAFNLAADPVLDADRLTQRFGGVRLPVPVPLLRTAAAATWHARLQPTEPGWVRLAAQAPLMSRQRAETELGWLPRISAVDAVAELFAGMADRSGLPTAPLRQRPGAGARLAAMVSGHLPGQGDPY